VQVSFQPEAGPGQIYVHAEMFFCLNSDLSDSCRVDANAMACHLHDYSIYACIFQTGEIC